MTNPKYFWTFEESTGTKATVGGAKITSDRESFGPGKVGRALRFNPHDGGRVVTTELTDLPVPWTAAMWVKREADSAGATLFSSDRYALKLEQWENQHKVGFSVFGKSDATFDFTAPIGEWVHLTLIGTAADTKLYANGKLVGTMATSGALGLQWIGSTGGYVEFASMSLDEVKIFDTALTDAEVATLAEINKEIVHPGSFTLIDVPVFIENQETKRYLFSDGPPIKGARGAEGGWLSSSGFQSPNVVGADANYYNRALWIIRQVGNAFFIENQETKRYLFSDGPPIKGERGSEGGWKAASGFESPKVVGADANYYNRALWTLQPSGNAFLIENQETKRYLFSDGPPIKGERGAEGGWLASSGFASPSSVGADANYYNRALWIIKKAG